MADTPFESGEQSPPSSAKESNQTRGNRNRRRNRRGKNHRPEQSTETEQSPRTDVVAPPPEPRPQPPVSRPVEPVRPPGRGYADGIDHQICAYRGFAAVKRHPVLPRAALAVMPLRVVATMDDRELLCDQLHEGDCAWPDLTPVDPDQVVRRNWQIVREGDGSNSESDS